MMSVALHHINGWRSITCHSKTSKLLLTSPHWQGGWSGETSHSRYSANQGYGSIQNFFFIVFVSGTDYQPSWARQVHHGAQDCMSKAQTCGIQFIISCLSHIETPLRPEPSPPSWENLGWMWPQPSQNLQAWTRVGQCNSIRKSLFGDGFSPGHKEMIPLSKSPCPFHIHMQSKNGTQYVQLLFLRRTMRRLPTGKHGSTTFGTKPEQPSLGK